MKNLLQNLIDQSSVKPATEEVINSFLKDPYSFKDIKSTINSYVILSDNYCEIFRQLYNKLLVPCSPKDLRLFLDILILNYKIEKKNIIDPSDMYLFSNFEPLNLILQSYTSKINSFCYGYQAKYKLKNDYANRYRKYDFLRRMQMLRLNFIEIFKIYDPYHCKSLPEEQKLFLDFLLNSIYPNIVAILDSLAFILQYEFNIIPDINFRNTRDLAKISLFSKNFILELQKTSINNFIEWFKEIKQLRHSMSHRMPFYNVQVLGDNEIELFNAKQAELSKMSTKSLQEIELIRSEYNNAVKNNSKISKDILDKLTKTIRDHEVKIEDKHKKISSLGPFTGIFTDDVQENNLHHISRILLDIQKMFLAIDIVINYIADRISSSSKLY